MGTYSRTAELPLHVDGYELEGCERPVSSGFTRRTTLIRLSGGGEAGIGEDVTYDADEQTHFQAAGAVHDLSGSHTLRTLSEVVGNADLFPLGAPRIPEWQLYRRWGFESAALDLALRQAGRSFADALGKRPAPVHFVVSLRLPAPPTTEPIRRLLALYPETRLKLDPTADWDEQLVAELAALGAVATLDLKSAYRGTIVDQPPDARLYRLVAEAFPEALIEDPGLHLPETAAALEPYRERISWDAVIHSVSDIEALSFVPRALNIKPSRFGSLEALLDAYDYCARSDISTYGGGQFELGPGRGQIQYLASLFHPDAPNDVAPIGYNEPRPAAGLPTSPLEPAPAPTGFRWGPVNVANRTDEA